MGGFWKNPPTKKSPAGSRTACTNGVMDVFDPDAKSLGSRFYRLAPPAAVPGLKLGLGSARPLSSKGLEPMPVSLIYK